MEWTIALTFLIFFVVLILVVFLGFCRTGWTHSLTNFQVWKGRIFGFKAWHFLNEDLKLRYDDNREVKEGETLSQLDLTRKPDLCQYGMHASVKLRDAIECAPGPVLTQVLVKGKVNLGRNKLTGRHRKCLKIIGDIRPILIQAMVEAIRVCFADELNSDEQDFLTQFQMNPEFRFQGISNHQSIYWLASSRYRYNRGNNSYTGDVRLAFKHLRVSGKQHFKASLRKAGLELDWD